jgi:hypothetical protein
MLVSCDGGGSFRGEPLQLFGVRQPTNVGIECLVLPRGRLQLVNLAHDEAEVVGSPRCLQPALFELPLPRTKRDHLRVRIGDAPPRRRGLHVGIQQFALVIGIDQLARIMLAVHAHQARPDIGQERRRDRRPVDPCP